MFLSFAMQQIQFCKNEQDIYAKTKLITAKAHCIASWEHLLHYKGLHVMLSKS